jgi:hypothetical protein
VIVLAVIPGADACSAPDDEDLPLLPQAATSMLTAARAAMGARPSLSDLFI